MSLAKEKLERFFTPLNGSPRQRGISLGIRIRVTHVGALYESFHEEKIVFYQMRHKGFQSGTWVVAMDPKEIDCSPCTALLRRTEASLSAIRGQTLLEAANGRGVAGGGKDGEEGKDGFRTMAGIVPDLRFQISSAEGSLRCHETIRVTHYAVERIATRRFVFILAAMPKVVSRAAVSTSQDG